MSDEIDDKFRIKKCVACHNELIRQLRQELKNSDKYIFEMTHSHWGGNKTKKEKPPEYWLGYIRGLKDQNKTIKELVEPFTRESSISR